MRPPAAYCVAGLERSSCFFSSALTILPVSDIIQKSICRRKKGVYRVGGIAFLQEVFLPVFQRPMADGLILWQVLIELPQLSAVEIEGPLYPVQLPIFRKEPLDLFLRHYPTIFGPELLQGFFAEDMLSSFRIIPRPPFKLELYN